MSLKIESYKKKNGEVAYQLKAYLGIDPLTGKKKFTTKRGFKTKRAAQQYYKDLITNINVNGFEQATEIETFQQLYELWLDQYKNTVKESTLEKTLLIFKLHILPVFEGIQLKRLNIPFCQKVVNTWYETNAKYKLFLNYTNRILDYGVKMSILMDNPARKVDIPKKMVQVEDLENDKIKFLEKEELTRLLAYFDDHSNKKASTFYRLLAKTGMRVGEAAALTWEDIDFQANTISITKTSVLVNKKQTIQTPKSKKSIRTIYIDDKLIADLKKWQLEQKKELFKLGYNSTEPKQLLFSNTNNGLIRYTTIRKWLDTITKKYQFPDLTPHVFRHTHCTLLFEAGASIKEVQDRLGHSDVKTTLSIYQHLSDSKKEETALKFANYIEF